METQVRKRLPETTMLAVCNAMKRGQFTEGVVLVYKQFGIDLSDPNGPQISPSDYAIPEDQWGTICQAAMASGSQADPISIVNRGMDWMNISPSGYAVEA